MALKATENMKRAWNDVANDIRNPDFTLANVSYTAGFLQGCEKYHGAALVIALAEQAYGDHPELLRLKRKVGIFDNED
jgi:hypothetical protein